MDGDATDDNLANELTRAFPENRRGEEDFVGMLHRHLTATVLELRPETDEAEDHAFSLALRRLGAELEARRDAGDATAVAITREALTWGLAAWAAEQPPDRQPTGKDDVDAFRRFLADVERRDAERAIADRLLGSALGE